MDRTAVFDRLRAGILGPALDQGEVDGVNAILDVTANWNANQQAYALATAFHETGGTMRPIHEWGTDRYFRERYDPQGSHPEIAARLGNTIPGDGVRFAGRGFVQLTGRINYRVLGQRIGQPLEDNPPLAMQTAIAAQVLGYGMAEGLFTRHRLGEFVGAGEPDFYNARKVINGLDRADLVAGYAKRFRAALG